LPRPGPQDSRGAEGFAERTPPGTVRIHHGAVEMLAFLRLVVVEDKNIDTCRCGLFKNFPVLRAAVHHHQGVPAHGEELVHDRLVQAVSLFVPVGDEEADLLCL
jgi:hypothetical protein